MPAILACKVPIMDRLSPKHVATENKI